MVRRAEQVAMWLIIMLVCLAGIVVIAGVCIARDDMHDG
jgi:hypothetical protein